MCGVNFDKSEAQPQPLIYPCRIAASARAREYGPARVVMTLDVGSNAEEVAVQAAAATESYLHRGVQRSFRGGYRWVP